VSDDGGKGAFLSRDIYETISVIVYVVVAMGNSGNGGLQTGANPGNAAGVVTVASVDNILALLPIIITPDGSKIHYQAGSAFGGWKLAVNSTIVVNSQFIFSRDI
jgi:hypothetical protein